MTMPTIMALHKVARLLSLVACAVANAQSPAGMASPAGATALFDPIARVATHPRCVNCHQAEVPRQTELSLRHTQGVLRGRDGHGARGMQCASCHQGANTAEGRVPGAKHWQLAPLSMSWQGLKAGEICRQMQDPFRNGNRRTPAQVINHMASDPLVLWAWEPGGERSKPPLSHADFLRALHVWAQQGMPCRS